MQDLILYNVQQISRYTMIMMLNDIIIYDIHMSSISKIMTFMAEKQKKHNNKLTDYHFTSDK
jgi:hypothetical protein